MSCGSGHPILHDAVRLLPFGCFVVDSEIPPEVVAARLTKVVERPKWIRFGDQGLGYFEGHVTTNKFRVWEISHCLYIRRRIGPVLAGGVEPSDGGSRIHVRLRPTIMQSIFLLLWIAGGVALVALGVRAAIRGQPGFVALAIFNLAIWSAAWVVMVPIAWWWEADANKRELLRILSTDEQAHIDCGTDETRERNEPTCSSNSTTRTAT